MILCLGLAADETFLYSLSALKRAGIPFHAIDLVQLAYGGDIHIPLADLSSAEILLHGQRYRLCEYQGAWIRLLDISAGAPDADLEHRSQGLYQALSRMFSAAPLPVINPPFGENSNFAKVFHAVTLAAAGKWQIPRSCLTNDRHEVQQFLRTCPDGVIFKGASAVKTWATLYDRQAHEERLPLIKDCPVLFQERIVGPDVRVHAVGDQVFAEMITSPDLDYRRVRKNTYRPISLPTTIAEGCRALTAFCETPFLGIDFKVQEKTGEWFFLEANSLPCYQGYDRRAGGAISQAIIDWLMASVRCCSAQ